MLVHLWKTAWVKNSFTQCRSFTKKFQLELFSTVEKTTKKTMPYQIIRNRSGWVLDQEGNVLIRDVETQEDMWVENNVIYFNEQNKPCITFDDNGTMVEEILTFHHEEPNITPEETFDESLPRNTWTHEATLALISSVESRYDDLFNIHKKKHFWTIIHEELLSHGLNFPSKICQKKWENLNRTYKNCKDLKTRTGRGPTRFAYFERLDEILGRNPCNAGIHTIDVYQMSEEITPIHSTDSSTDKSPSPSNKRKNLNTEYIKLKKKYYEEKQKENVENKKKKEKYIEDTLALKKERNEYVKKRVALEERKVIALEKLASDNK